MVCPATTFWIHGRGCVFLQELVSVSNWFVGIVTEWSHVLKYAGVNPECFPKIC